MSIFVGALEIHYDNGDDDGDDDDDDDFKTKTKRSRPRLHDPRPRLSFLSSRRLETKTLVSRTT